MMAEEAVRVFNQSKHKQQYSIGNIKCNTVVSEVVLVGDENNHHHTKDTQDRHSLTKVIKNTRSLINTRIARK